jgi:hypothetical protein
VLRDHRAGVRSAVLTVVSCPASTAVTCSGIREDHRTRTEDRSGGPGGIVHGLEPFGPPTEAWSRDLGQVMLIPQLVAEIVAGVDEELPAVDPAEPVARRDAVLDALPAAEARTDL